MNDLETLRKLRDQRDDMYEDYVLPESTRAVLSRIIDALDPDNAEGYAGTLWSLAGDFRNQSEVYPEDTKQGINWRKVWMGRENACRAGALTLGLLVERDKWGEIFKDGHKATDLFIDGAYRF